MKKIAYLTIDDAPNKDFLKKVDFLLSKKIPTIWFCRGELIEHKTEELVYALEKGQVIGNHAWDNPYFSNLSIEKCFQQIKKTDKALEKVYQAAKINWQYKYFRFPYGDKGGNKNSKDYEKDITYDKRGVGKKEKIQNFLRSLGYTKPKFKGITYKYYYDNGYDKDVDWYWTYDCLEYALFSSKNHFGINSIEKVFSRMDEDVPEGCRGLNYPNSEDIILLHDHEETTKYFEPILNRLLQKKIELRRPE